MISHDLMRDARSRLRSAMGRRRRGVSRRDFLKAGTTGSVLAAALGAWSQKAAGREIGRRSDKSGGLSLPKSSRGGLDPTLLKLVDRTSFGFTRAAYDDAAAMGYNAYLESQLDHLSIDDSDVEARLAGYDTLSMTSEQIYVTYGEMLVVPVLQLMESTILRSVYSKRQLHERMVEFWTDHFNIDILDGFCSTLKTADDRDVIRQHALGTFPDLLNASAHSACMLFYLDNYANTVGHAQENYARELMELHTMGVNGGYTQQDVEEVARCLTGWAFVQRVDLPTPNFGDFIFRSGQHDNQPKTVLGQTIHNPGDGLHDGLDVLDLLAYHPSTARFIAKKLCTRFLGYNPPEDVVEMTKDTYLATGGDIKEMLRVILQPTVLNYLLTPKFKRPFHHVASILRATDAEISLARFLVDYLLVMGQAPFFWSAPNGYPDQLNDWANSLLPRWQFASALFDNFIPGVTVDEAALLQSEGGNVPGGQAGAINRILTGGRMTTKEVSLLQDFYDGVPPGYPSELQDAFGLAASLPSTQWY